MSGGVFVVEVALEGGKPKGYQAHGIKAGRSSTPGGVVIRFGAGTFSPVRVDVELPPAAVPALIAALRQAVGVVEEGGS